MFNASTPIVAFWMFVIFAALFILADTAKGAVERRRRRLRREGWRAHRAYMDSVEPRRWRP